ncbi:MAG TPA: hypothetical protein VHJ78_07850 [Actinomycetota bacterium]|nr:hypothetical protein [Actinomycetota bacterium]
MALRTADYEWSRPRAVIWPALLCSAAVAVWFAVSSFSGARVVSPSIGDADAGTGSAPIAGQAEDAAVEDLVALGAALQGDDPMTLDDTPSGVLCDRQAGSCIGSMDAANYKNGCIVGDAFACVGVVRVLSLECAGGSGPACDAARSFGDGR